MVRHEEVGAVDRLFLRLIAGLGEELGIQQPFLVEPVEVLQRSAIAILVVNRTQYELAAVVVQRLRGAVDHEDHLGHRVPGGTHVGAHRVGVGIQLLELLRRLVRLLQRLGDGDVVLLEHVVAPHPHPLGGTGLRRVGIEAEREVVDAAVTGLQLELVVALFDDRPVEWQIMLQQVDQQSVLTQLVHRIRIPVADDVRVVSGREISGAIELLGQFPFDVQAHSHVIFDHIEDLLVELGILRPEELRQPLELQLIRLGRSLGLGARRQRATERDGNQRRRRQRNRFFRQHKESPVTHGQHTCHSCRSRTLRLTGHASHTSCQPFRMPIITPFTKYLCTNG